MFFVRVPASSLLPGQVVGQVNTDRLRREYLSDQGKLAFVNTVNGTTILRYEDGSQAVVPGLTDYAVIG